VRVDRAEENAKIIANRLLEHPSVTAVHYPGLPNHPNAQIHQTQTDGPGSVISFEVKGGAQGAENVCGAVALMTYATSLGGVETLIERRRRWPNENLEVPESLIRLAVGIENVEDLWRDLAQALETA
jgi:cystathionine gamma-synthase